MTATTTPSIIVNFNVVFFDDVHAASVKPINLLLLGAKYATDGSKAIIENQLSIIFADILTNNPIPAGSPSFIQETDSELPNAYCMNDGDPIHPTMTGAFLDWYATPDVVANRTAMTNCRAWFVKTAVDWMIKNGLSPKTKTPPVVGAYLEKIISNVTVTNNVR